MDTTFMFTMSVFLCVSIVHGKSIRPEDLILESHGYHMVVVVVAVVVVVIAIVCIGNVVVVAVVVVVARSHFLR